MNPCLTVVVPCYNEESTIEELLIRVLNQDSVKELIVVNDASSDRSLEIIKGVNDTRMKILNNEK